MRFLVHLPIPLEEYVPPGLKDFEFEGIAGISWLNKPMLQLIIAALLVAGAWLWGTRKLALVPNKTQYLFESGYEYIRNSVGRDIIGPGYQRWVPFLVATFFFILVNNWFGEFFLFMFPTLSNIGFAYGMGIFVLLVYVYAGFSHHGWRYLYKSVTPAGVPKFLLPFIVPLEIISNYLTRPFTLAIRVFANVFAGHMALLVFIVGGGYLLFTGNPIYIASGVISLAFSIVMMGLELFIGFLQALIFTILTASYIASAISEDH